MFPLKRERKEPNRKITYLGRAKTILDLLGIIKIFLAKEANR